MQDYNESHTYPLTTAKGYAIDELRNITEENLSDFIQKADDAMYQNKKAMKKGTE